MRTKVRQGDQSGLSSARASIARHHRHIQTTILRSPLVKRRCADAILPTDIRNWYTAFNPFQRFNNLTIRKFRLLHVEPLNVRKFYFKLRLFAGGITRLLSPLGFTSRNREKPKNFGYWKGILAEWRMITDLLHVVYPLELISQTYHLLSLRVNRSDTTRSMAWIVKRKVQPKSV